MRDAHGQTSNYRVFPVEGIILLADPLLASGMYMLDLDRGVIGHPKRPEFLCAQTAKFMAPYQMWINQAKGRADQREQLAMHMPGGKLPLIAVSMCGIWFHVGSGAESMWLCATLMQELHHVDAHRCIAAFKFERHTATVEIYHPHLNFAMMNRIWQYCREVDDILLPVWRRILVALAPSLLKTSRFNTDLTTVESLLDVWREAVGKGDPDHLKQLLMARMNSNFDIVGSNAQLMQELLDLAFDEINESGKIV
ncbi:hypothetical protein [Lacticaseibacillus sp. GG6-2]